MVTSYRNREICASGHMVDPYRTAGSIRSDSRKNTSSINIFYPDDNTQPLSCLPDPPRPTRAFVHPRRSEVNFYEGFLTTSATELPPNHRLRRTAYQAPQVQVVHTRLGRKITHAPLTQQPDHVGTSAHEGHRYPVQNSPRVKQSKQTRPINYNAWALAQPMPPKPHTFSKRQHCGMMSPQRQHNHEPVVPTSTAPWGSTPTTAQDSPRVRRYVNSPVRRLYDILSNSTL